MNFELARQLVLDWKDKGEVSDLLNADGTFWASYGDQEDWIVDGVANAIGIRNLSLEYGEEASSIRFGDRLIEIPPEREPGDQRMLFKTLNETLTPEFEVRRVRSNTL